MRFAQRATLVRGATLFAVTALFSFTLAFAVDVASKGQKRINPGYWPTDCTEAAPSPARADIAALIGIRTKVKAEAKRQELIDFIWKGRGLPDWDTLDLRMNVDNPITTVDLKNLTRVDELVVTTDRLKSHIFRFRPVAPNGRLAIYHAGHSEYLGDVGGDITIQSLLDLGYEVLGFSMPGYGPNTRLPMRADAATAHDSFEHLETSASTPLKYFVEPVAVALNYVIRRHDYDEVRMIGVSGGGWTTTLYAAIDPRIRVSYPVAGSLPLSLRSAACGAPEMGDWEQSRSGLYAIVDYTELYVLGAYGEGRKQIQVLNEFDSCCFWGRRHRVYEHQVRRIVRGLGGGSFRVLLDRSTYDEHAVTPWALDQLLMPENAKGHARHPKARNIDIRHRRDEGGRGDN